MTLMTFHSGLQGTNGTDTDRRTSERNHSVMRPCSRRGRMIIIYDHDDDDDDDVQMSWCFLAIRRRRSDPTRNPVNIGTVRRSRPTGASPSPPGRSMTHLRESRKKRQSAGAATWASSSCCRKRASQPLPIC